jgi:integrase
MPDGLTKRIVETTKPGDRPVEIRDRQVPGLLLRIQPSGVRSYIVEWRRGRRVTLGRAGILTLEQARAEARKALVEADESGAPMRARPRARTDTLEEFLDNAYGPWVETERKWGRGSVLRIKSRFPELLRLRLVAIDPYQVERWRSARRRAGRAPTTINRDLASLRSALAKAVEWGMLKEHPLRTVKAAKTDPLERIRYLSAEEAQRLRAGLVARDTLMREARRSGNAWRADRQCEPLPTIDTDGFGDHLTPLVLTALNTGLRRGELTSLTWADIDLEGGSLTVRSWATKSRLSRTVPLNSEVREVLTRWRRQHPDGRVFPVKDVKTAFSALKRAAGLPNFRFHDLRHTFASNLVMRGVDLNTVRELLGHADIKMTLRYAHLAPAHKAEAVERLVG